MTHRKRNSITSFLTVAFAAALAVGGATALASTGAKKANALNTPSAVSKYRPKLERKDVWQKKAIDFDCMWRERR